ncbi:MAG: DUF2306 domain-containing protein [Myxococcota bacterium]
MDFPWGVIIIYAGLVTWLVLFVRALRQGGKAAWRGFAAFGIGLLLFLNVRYFVEGIPASIAFFIGIYDVLINLGVPPEGAVAIAGCQTPDCSVWGERFAFHPEWGVAFHARFLEGPELRRNLLHGHIFFNSVAFVLMHVQLHWPGIGARRRLHKHLGRVTFAAVSLGVVCACWLASEHHNVDAYGGSLSAYGFYFMSACVMVPAIFSAVTIRRGDLAAHRVWTFRFAGAMWGSFWLFRVMLFVLDPLLRDVRAAAILACIWLSAPLGIVIAEAFRHARERARDAPDSAALPLAAE